MSPYCEVFNLEKPHAVICVDLDIGLCCIPDNFVHRPPSPLVQDLDSLRTGRDDSWCTDDSQLDRVEAVVIDPDTSTRLEYLFQPG